MARRLPPLNALRAFESAARHLSFTKAAGELNVTPAAISHQVKSLEEILGLELFHRLTRGLSLTEAGRGYLPALTETFDRLVTATEGLRGQEVSGRLIITTMPSLADRWLIHRIGDFHRRYPEVDIVLRAEERRVDFIREEIDVGIRYGRGEWRGLRSTWLMDEQVFPVCAPSLMNGPKPIRKLSDLRHHSLLHDFGAHATEPWLNWDVWFREAGLTDIDASRGLHFSNTALILKAAIAGEGVALGRSALLENDLRAGRLVRPMQATRPADYGYYIVSPEATADLPKIAAFRSWILESARRSGHAEPLPRRGEG